MSLRSYKISFAKDRDKWKRLISEMSFVEARTTGVEIQGVERLVLGEVVFHVRYN